jgi:hypothetical protein
MSKKITDLPVVTDLTATDSFLMLDPEGVTGAKTKRATLEKLAAYVVAQVPVQAGGSGGPAGISQSQLDAGLATKADKSALDTKADTSALASKADTSALNFKADKSTVDSLSSALAGKADQTAVNAKADATTVTTLQGTVSNLSTTVDSKASAAQVDAISNSLAAIKASSQTYGAPSGVATRTGFDTGTVTLTQLAERMKALLDDLNQKGILAYLATGGGSGPVVVGNPDSPTIAGVPFALPTKANTGYRGALAAATTITTDTSQAFYRSGTQITVKDNATVAGYDLQGYNIVIQGANNTIRDNLFDAAIGNFTIYIGDNNNAAINNTIEYNTFDGKKANAGNNHGSFIFFSPRTPQKSISYNQVINAPCDGFTWGGSVEKVYWNYFEGMGWRDGAHPDCITINAGFSGQPLTAITYCYFDNLGPENRTLGSNASVKIADNADLRGNILVHRCFHRGGSIQHQISTSLINADVEFSENYRYVIGGQPIYDVQTGATTNHSWGGPYGAFEGGTYSSTAPIHIHDEIEIRNGLPAKEVDSMGVQTSQLVFKAATGRPNQVVVNSIAADGTFSIQAVSGATSYQYCTSVANSGVYGAWNTLTATGSGTLTGTLTLIANAVNHVYIRAMNGAGPGPRSLAKQIASGTVINAAPAWTTAPVLQGTAQEGQVLSATAGVGTGTPTPSPSYLWERDTGGNGVAISLGVITSGYTVQNTDIGNRVRRTTTLTNGISPPAVSSTAWSATVIAAAGTIPPTATIQYTSQGTVGTSAINTSSGANTLSATAGAPSGTGGLLLLGVHYSSVDTATIPTPSGWTRQAGYDFFGNDGIVVFSKPGGLTDPAVTIQTPDERQGDRLICQQFRFTGGSSTVEAVAADFGTVIGDHPLNAAGANRLSVIFWSNQRDARTKTSIVGNAGTGYSELAETATTTADTYMPTFAVDIKTALTTGSGNVTPGVRAWATTPERQSFVHLLLF